MNLNSNSFRDMYSEMGINIDKLGCIMLDVNSEGISKPEDEVLYHTQNHDRFWIKGFVAGKTPHVTLLYGLMESGQKNKHLVDKVLSGWNIGHVAVDHVGYFESPYVDDPYYCIIAHLKISDELMEGHKRLEFLPHINTFPDYKAHITLAYVKKDEGIRDRVINMYTEEFSNRTFLVMGLNYGK